MTHTRASMVEQLEHAIELRAELRETMEQIDATVEEVVIRYARFTGEARLGDPDFVTDAIGPKATSLYRELNG